MKNMLSLLGLMLFSLSLSAQFSLEADIRPRTEFRDGYRRMPQDDEKPAVLTSQRTRLIMDYKTERLETKVSFHDLRIWGQQELRANQPSFDLHEAWVQLAVSNNLFVKAGRQELRYDNQRFFAINDWIPGGQKHDALVWRLMASKGELHLGTAFNQSIDRTFGTPFGLNNYKFMQYAWYQTRLSESMMVSLLGVADGWERPDNASDFYMRYTWSVFPRLKLGERAQLRLNPAYQHGETRQGVFISAWYFMAEAETGLGNSSRLVLGAELFSGNDHTDTQDQTYRAFDPLYGAGHTVHGYMDYFTAIPAHTLGAGFINPYLKTTHQLSPRTRFDADLHLFFLQHDLPVNQGSPDERLLDKYLGTEIDLTLAWSIMPQAQMMFGYSVMFGSETMEFVKGGKKDNWAHWAYVMLRVRPKFL